MPLTSNALKTSATTHYARLICGQRDFAWSCVLSDLQMIGGGGLIMKPSRQNAAPSNRTPAPELAVISDTWWMAFGFVRHIGRVLLSRTQRGTPMSPCCPLSRRAAIARKGRVLLPADSNLMPRWFPTMQATRRYSTPALLPISTCL